MSHVVGIGTPAVDYFLQTDISFLEKINVKPEDDLLLSDIKLSLKDITSRLRLIAKSPGGITINTLAVLSKLKIKTAFLGTVGKDRQGGYLLNLLKDVDTTKVVRRGKTSNCFCLLTKSGRERTFLSTVNIHENEFFNNIDLNYLNSATFIHISPLITDRQEGINKTVKLVSKIEGPKISFSPGFFYASLGLRKLAPILKRTYILFINRRELKILIGGDPKIAIKKLLKLGPQIIVLTLSEEGSQILTKNKNFRVKASVVKKILDTTGAGDTYAAGFLYGLLKNKSLEWSAKFASQLAAQSLSDYGINSLNNDLHNKSCLQK